MLCVTRARRAFHAGPLLGRLVLIAVNFSCASSRARSRSRSRIIAGPIERLSIEFGESEPLSLTRLPGEDCSLLVGVGVSTMLNVLPRRGGRGGRMENTSPGVSRGALLYGSRISGGSSPATLGGTEGRLEGGRGGGGISREKRFEARESRLLSLCEERRSRPRVDSRADDRRSSVRLGSHRVSFAPPMVSCAGWRRREVVGKSWNRSVASGIECRWLCVRMSRRLVGVGDGGARWWWFEDVGVELPGVPRAELERPGVPRLLRGVAGDSNRGGVPGSGALPSSWERVRNRARNVSEGLAVLFRREGVVGS